MVVAQDEPAPKASMHASDHVLLSRISDKDTTALSELYDKHHLRMYAMAMNCSSSDEEAETMMCDAFAAIWRAPWGFMRHALISDDLLSLVLSQGTLSVNLSLSPAGMA